MNINPDLNRRILSVFIFLAFIFCWNNKVLAQKILSEHETQIVLEARNELNEALSNPDLDQTTRSKLVERSAKTLKEYGQPSGFPQGDIPLKELMQENFGKATKQYNDANILRQEINSKQLDAKMKFINALQIEVVEEQVKFLIPGKAPVELSKDLVGTVFSWNIAEGFNQGKVDDAKTLVGLFKKSAEANKLSGQLDQLFKDHQFTVNNIHRDLKLVDPLEAQLRKKYELATASTFTIKGYEGAQLYGNSASPASASGTNATTAVNLSLDSSLFGTWLHTDNNRKQSGWQFNSDGTAVQFVRSEKITGWKWEVRGGMLYIIGGNGKSEDYVYKFEGNNLYMEVTLLGQQVWSAPMLKQ